MRRMNATKMRWDASVAHASVLLRLNAKRSASVEIACMKLSGCTVCDLLLVLVVVGIFGLELIENRRDCSEMRKSNVLP